MTTPLASILPWFFAEKIGRTNFYCGVKLNLIRGGHQKSGRIDWQESEF